jgi:hypothetical protein
MVVVSREAAATYSRRTRHKRAVCGNDHDQARREDKDTEAGLVAN